MFATLAGGLPAPTPEPGRSGYDPGAAVALQLELGLEPVTDGEPDGDPLVVTALGLGGVGMGADGRPARVDGMPLAWHGAILVERWRDTAARTDRAVKQAVGGPYSLGHLLAAGFGDAARARLTIELAEALHEELSALAAAGCPLIQVDEPAAVRLGDSPAEAALFRDAQRRLLGGIEDAHVSLAVTGGNAHGAGPGPFYDAPYASYLFDLIDGPDNWHLIARAPADRGIVCGAVPGGDQPTVDKEVVVWAAHYAAATMGRGLVRVGLATSGSLRGLSWEAARRRLELLALAAEIAVEPGRRMAERLDPHAFKAAPQAPRAG